MNGFDFVQTRYKKCNKWRTALLAAVLFGSYVKAAAPAVLNSTNKSTSLDLVGQAAQCYTKYPYKSVPGNACDFTASTLSWIDLIADPFDRSFYVRWNSPVQIRSVYNWSKLYTNHCDLYVTSTLPFDRTDSRLQCKLGVWINGVSNCQATLIGQYLVLMTVDGESSWDFESYEIRAWSTKDLALSGTVSNGKQNLVGITTDGIVNSSTFSLNGYIDLGANYYINKVWARLGANAETVNISVGTGTTTPTGPYSTVWTKAGTASGEEWNMAVVNVLTRYIYICTGSPTCSGTASFFKVAVFETCDTSQLTTTLTTVYSLLSPILPTLAITWPTYTISPNDCVITLSNLQFKDALGTDLIAAGLFSVDWSLKTITFNCALGCYDNVTMFATFNSLTPYTDSGTLLQFNCCKCSQINQQTMTPVAYQILPNSPNSQSILSFPMHTDTRGQALSNPTICSLKTYLTNQPWLTVLTPSDPLAQNFQLMVDTSNYLLAGVQSASLVVGFADAGYTQTITQTLSITLLHPCKITLITTSQTIQAMSFGFGGPALVTNFFQFSDSIATAYGIPNLCALKYKLSLAADATAYGVTINQTAPSISVLTTNSMLKGTSVTLTLSADSLTNQQDTPSNSVTFQVSVIDPCPTTAIQLSFSTLAAMTYTIAQAAATQTFVLGTDSLSVSYSTPNFCGPISYSIVEAYSFVSVTFASSPGTISVQSNQISDVGTHPVTLKAVLTNWPLIPSVQVSFSLTIVNPCLTTTLNLPTMFNAVTIGAFSGLSSQQLFAPATDSASTAAAIPELCGPRVYSIVEAQPQQFVSAISPTPSDPYTANWTLKCQSFSYSDFGVWTVTLSVTLQNYTSVPAATQQVQVTVTHPCQFTSIQSQTITPSPFQIQFSVTTAQTIAPFMMNQDSAGVSQLNGMFCGIKTYATNQPWLTVLTPANPQTQPFELQVTTNDYMLAGTYSINLVIGFADVTWTATLTQTLSVQLLHPCKITQITTTQTISNISFMFDDPQLATPFVVFIDTVSQQYSQPLLCALSYSLSPAFDATNFAVSLQTTPSLAILVQTTNFALVGQTVNLTLNANASPQQDMPSTAVPITVFVDHHCLTTSINAQTFVTPLPYQIVFASNLATVAQFMMNSDLAGNTRADPMYCGVKTYTTDKPWATVITPADPLTQNFLLQITTNDHTLAGTQVVTLTIGFANPVFTATLTQTITVQLLHPCVTTLITTTQTQGAIQYTYGDSALLTAFSDFDDSVSLDYNLPGLCSLVYSLNPPAIASSFGASIQTSPLAISVLTTDTSLMGQTISLAIKANAIPQQTAASQTVSFSIEVICTPCTPSLTLPNISQPYVYYIKQPAVAKTIMFNGVSNNNCAFATSLTPLDATVFTYSEVNLQVDPVFYTMYSVASVPVLTISTGDISKESTVDFILSISSLAPGDSTTMTFPFSIQLIDNPCTKGFTGIPADIKAFYSLLQEDLKFEFKSLNNNDCTFKLSLVNTGSQTLSPSLITLVQPTFTTITGAIDLRQVFVNNVPSLSIYANDASALGSYELLLRIKSTRNALDLLFVDVPVNLTVVVVAVKWKQVLPIKKTWYIQDTLFAIGITEPCEEADKANVNFQSISSPSGPNVAKNFELVMHNDKTYQLNQKKALELGTYELTIMFQDTALPQNFGTESVIIEVLDFCTTATLYLAKKPQNMDYISGFAARTQQFTFKVDSGHELKCGPVAVSAEIALEEGPVGTQFDQIIRFNQFDQSVNVNGIFLANFSVRVNLFASISSNSKEHLTASFVVNCITSKQETSANSDDVSKYYIKIDEEEQKETKTHSWLPTSPFKPIIEFTNTVGRFRIRFNKKWKPPTYAIYPEFLKPERMQTNCTNGVKCLEELKDEAAKSSQDNMSRRRTLLNKVEKEEAIAIINKGLSPINQVMQPILEIELAPGAMSNRSMMNFTWECVEVTDYFIEFEINYTHPQEISIHFDKDYLKAKFTAPQYFQSAEGLFLSNNEVEQTKELPMQISKELGLKIAQAANIVSSSTTSAAALNVILNILLGSALQQMFEFMKKAQIMVHLLIINVAIPGVAQIFFNGLLGFVTFDVINWSPYIRRMFNLYLDSSVNDNFYNLGYSSRYFVVNLGTLYLMMGYIILKVIFTVSTPCIKHEKFIKVRNWFAKGLFWNQVIQFVQESFIILCVCCFANFTSLKFDQAGKTVNNIFAILTMAAILFYTFYSYIFLKKNRDKLKTKDFKAKYGYLYETIRINGGLNELKEPMIQSVRVIVLIFSILFLQDFHNFQMMVSQYSWTALIIYIGLVKPYKESKFYTLELLNEFFVALVNYHLICFADFVTDYNTLQLVGYSLILTMMVNIVINISILVFCAVRDTYKTQRIKHYVLKKRKLLAKLFEKEQKKAAVIVVDLLPEPSDAVLASRLEERKKFYLQDDHEPGHNLIIQAELESPTNHQLRSRPAKKSKPQRRQSPTKSPRRIPSQSPSKSLRKSKSPRKSVRKLPQLPVIKEASNEQSFELDILERIEQRAPIERAISPRKKIQNRSRSPRKAKLVVEDHSPLYEGQREVGMAQQQRAEAILPQQKQHSRRNTVMYQNQLPQGKYIQSSPGNVEAQYLRVEARRKTIVQEITSPEKAHKMQQELWSLNRHAKEQAQSISIQQPGRTISDGDIPHKSKFLRDNPDILAALKLGPIKPLQPSASSHTTPTLIEMTSKSNKTQGRLKSGITIDPVNFYQMVELQMRNYKYQ